MIIRDVNLLDVNKRYTYADYLQWHFEERVELIKGKLFKIAPAPNKLHQKNLKAISQTIIEFLK